MDSELIRCASCGQMNRVSAVGEGKKAVCGRCKAELRGGGHPVELTDANFAEQTRHGDAVVDFWAAWCGPCRTIAPVIEALAAERRDLLFGKLNVDHNRQTAARFGVQGIPLLVFFHNGVERGRLVGAVPRGEIESAIRKHLG